MANNEDGPNDEYEQLKKICKRKRKILKKRHKIKFFFLIFFSSSFLSFIKKHSTLKCRQKNWYRVEIHSVCFFFILFSKFRSRFKDLYLWNQEKPTGLSYFLSFIFCVCVPSLKSILLFTQTQIWIQKSFVHLFVLNHTKTTFHSRQ